MSKVVKKESTELESLSSILLSTLEESIFFSHLGKYISEALNAEQVKLFVVKDDSSAVLVSDKNGPSDLLTVLDKGQGPTGHVIKTKKPYFSNNTQRDPLFHEEAKQGIKAELAFPIVQEGIVIATVHLQTIKTDKEFAREDITKIQEITNGLKKPLTNMKMYLQAKFLNESLLKKIESKEEEIKNNQSTIVVAETYKIKEKEIVGNSDAMKKVISIADRISQSQVNLLLTGKKGTGKQMIARRIHCRSERAERSFVGLDCSALPEMRIEAEIFGEEQRDANIKSGLIETAHGGTLFINNIDRLSPVLQSKLMRFITEGISFRVNGQMPYKSDVRIIVASSKNLDELVEAGQFREDLFFSLNTMSLNVPSLSQRTDDIEILANYFLNLGKSRENQKSLSPCTLKALKDYNWPGNVRELHNVMERAYILSEGMIVEKDHLAECVHKVEKEEEIQEDNMFNFTEMTLDELEKKHICLTLDHLGGNKTKTARTLGITVKTLYNKLHSYGMISPKEA